MTVGKNRRYISRGIASCLVARPVQMDIHQMFNYFQDIIRRGRILDDSGSVFTVCSLPKQNVYPRTSPCDRRI